ncbi:hypothetical protein M8C21_034041, partial [Ambrosia artemisiifolia]
ERAIDIDTPSFERERDILERWGEREEWRRWKNRPSSPAGNHLGLRVKPLVMKKSIENRFGPTCSCASKDTTLNSDGRQAVADVWQVLDEIREVSKIKSTMEVGYLYYKLVGATGKALTNVITIVIGESSLFLHIALLTDNFMVKENKYYTASNG